MVPGIGHGPYVLNGISGEVSFPWNGCSGFVPTMEPPNQHPKLDFIPGPSTLMSNLSVLRNTSRMDWLS